MQNKPTKTTTFHDLLRNFKQAQVTTPHPQSKPKTKQLILKKLSRCPQNKQNHMERVHVQSMFEKKREKTENGEEQVLKEYNRKRKGRQSQLTNQKLITEATSVLTELIGVPPPQLLCMRITYIQFLSALQEMRLIRESYQPAYQDLPSQLWEDVVSNGQTAGVFILAVKGILSLSNTEEGLQTDYYRTKYSQLRYIRLQTMGRVRTVHDESEDHSFHPMISQRSRNLATSRSRSKRKDRYKGQKSCHQMEESFAQTSREHRYSENDRAHDYDPQVGNKRSKILYQMARERSMEKRKDRDRVDIQYEKSRKELTFHPKIHPNKKEHGAKKTIQGEQDSIDRMLRGRVEREVRKIIKEKGIPYNQKMFQRMKRQRYEAMFKPQPQAEEQLQVPEQFQAKEQEQQRTWETQNAMVLSVEVQEGRVEKLIVRQGEDYRQVAARFIEQLGLSSELEERLLGGIEKAMGFQLARIDEDSFESELQSVQ